MTESRLVHVHGPRDDPLGPLVEEEHGERNGQVGAAVERRFAQGPGSLHDSTAVQRRAEARALGLRGHLPAAVAAAAPRLAKGQRQAGVGLGLEPAVAVRGRRGGSLDGLRDDEEVGEPGSPGPGQRAVGLERLAVGERDRPLERGSDHLVAAGFFENHGGFFPQSPQSLPGGPGGGVSGQRRPGCRNARGGPILPSFPEAPSRSPRP